MRCTASIDDHLLLLVYILMITTTRVIYIHDRLKGGGGKGEEVKWGSGE